MIKKKLNENPSELLMLCTLQESWCWGVGEGWTSHLGHVWFLWTPERPNSRACTPGLDVTHTQTVRTPHSPAERDVLPNHWTWWVEPVSLPWVLVEWLQGCLSEPMSLCSVPIGVLGLRAGRQGHPLPPLADPWSSHGL